MPILSTRWCINCESPIDSSRSVTIYDDFCSQECADEYVASCDASILERSRSANDDALPVTNNVLQMPRASSIGHGQDKAQSLLQTSDRGELPPATLAAVQTMLSIGGVNQSDIDKVMATKPKPNVNTNSQNDTDDGNS